MFTTEEINFISSNVISNGNKGVIKKKYPKEYEEILKCEGGTWYHKLYNYIHPEPHLCIICGKPTKFLNFSRGYNTYCSCKCSANDPSKQEKAKLTWLEKYGVDHPSKSKQVRYKYEQTCLERYGATNTLTVKEFKEKAKQTCLERYGVENPILSKDIQEKHKQTCLERYGVEYMSQIPSAKDKKKQTCLERYGVENIFSNKEIMEKSIQTNLKKYGVRRPMQNDKFKKKRNQTCLKRYGVENPFQLDEVTSIKKNEAMNAHPEILYMEGTTWVCKCPHPDNCNKCSEKYYKISGQDFRSRKRQHTEPCTNLLPIQQTKFSTLELKVRSWLDDLGISYTTNDRSIIPPKEVDIYIPSKHLAIEVNGIFWHSDKNRPIRYHMDKWQLLHEKGVQMLTLWEDQLLNHEEIMHNILLSKLGVYEHRVGARKCSLRQVPGKEARAFLDQFHLQGHAGAKVNLGLYYNDTLVSLMTFGHRQVGHGWDNRSWELVRYCCRAGWQVVGGPSRQLRHFIEEYRPDSISSFSSNDISDGGLYTALGFESAGSAAPGYWYIDPEDFHRYHRYTFTKDQILHKGLAPSPNKSEWTERQVMDAWGYVRIYDSGQSKWKLECRYE